MEPKELIAYVCAEIGPRRSWKAHRAKAEKLGPLYLVASLLDTAYRTNRCAIAWTCAREAASLLGEERPQPYFQPWPELQWMRKSWAEQWHAMRVARLNASIQGRERP